MELDAAQPLLLIAKSELGRLQQSDPAAARDGTAAQQAEELRQLEEELAKQKAFELFKASPPRYGDAATWFSTAIGLAEAHASLASQRALRPAISLRRASRSLAARSSKLTLSAARSLVYTLQTEDHECFLLIPGTG